MMTFPVSDEQLLNYNILKHRIFCNTC